MAKEITINSWCDVCLETDKRTPAETLEVPAMLGAVAFVVELCGKHAAPLEDAHAALLAVGRAPDRKESRKRPRADSLPGEHVCPRCAHTCANIASLRVHARREHGSSLADIGYYAANVRCPECNDGYPNRQGLAAHMRTAHPGIKQPA